jgi:HSP20 family protein
VWTIRPRGPDWMPITPKTGSLFHAESHLAGRFDRTVALPIEIDPDRVKAECRDGVLALFLARAERDKPKSITIS